MKSIKEAEMKGKKVLMRAGFDVAIDEKTGEIIEDARIKETLKTINFILKQKPSRLTLLSHLGRPEGNAMEVLKLKRVAERLADLLSKNSELKEFLEFSPKVILEKSPVDIPWYKVSRRIYLLENVRFFPEEEKNDPQFAKKLSSLGELFVFEAFSAAHREQASVTGIMNYLPSFAGFELEKEVKELSKLLGEVRHPYVAIIGGAKVEDKAPVIDSLKKKVDRILVGGKVSNLLMSQRKYQGEEKIILASDGINKNEEVISAEDNPLDILDIGPVTIKLFRREVVKAKTILFAGPLGKIEETTFQSGTKQILFAVGYSHAYKLAAGGDTMEILNKFGLHQNFDFVSTGGGAALEFLAKGTLPAIAKLNQI